MTAERANDRTITVAAPHGWDAIGQALRCAYGNHRSPPDDIAHFVEMLDRID